MAARAYVSQSSDPHTRVEQMKDILGGIISGVRAAANAPVRHALAQTALLSHARAAHVRTE
jgi:hypothetical protein